MVSFYQKDIAFGAVIFGIFGIENTKNPSHMIFI